MPTQARPPAEESRCTLKSAARLEVPLPNGPMILYMRLYWPKAQAVEGKWTAPPLKRAD